MKPLLRRLWITLLALPTAAAGQMPQPLVAPPALGVLLPLSGQYQAFGEPCLRGIRLALHAVGNETPWLRTVVVDTKGDATEAVAAYRRLVADPSIIAVLGPMLSAEAAAIRGETAVARLPVVTLSQRAFPPGAPFFRFSMSKEDQAHALASYLVGEHGLTRWAILRPDDSFGRDVSIFFRDRVESVGGQIVADQSYDPAETDFQDEVQRLQAMIGTRASEDAPLDVHVDGIFLPDSADKILLLAPTLAFFDIQGVRLAGTSVWNDGEKILKALPYVNGAVFVDGFFLYSFLPAVRSFVDEYRDAYGANPGILEAYGYDAAGMLLDEIRYGATRRDRMIEHMHQPRVRAGATGWTTRTASGELEKRLFLLTVKDGTVREIERPEPIAPPAIRGPSGEPAPPPPSEYPTAGYAAPVEPYPPPRSQPGTLGEEPERQP